MVNKLKIEKGKWKIKKRRKDRNFQFATCNLPLRTKCAEGYVDVAITVMIVAFVLVFAVNMVSLVALNQNMKTVADQLVDYATLNGTTDIDDYAADLRTKTGVNFLCSFDGTDYHSGQKVQLGDKIVVTVTYHLSFMGFGEKLHATQVTASSSGLSQVYWKE